MTFSFRITVKLGGVITGVDQILDCAWKVSALLEVHGELSRDLWRTLAVVPQQLLAGLLVQQHASLVYQIAVKKILIKRV